MQYRFHAEPGADRETKSVLRGVGNAMASVIAPFFAKEKGPNGHSDPWPGMPALVAMPLFTAAAPKTAIRTNLAARRLAPLSFNVV